VTSVVVSLHADFGAISTREAAEMVAGSASASRADSSRSARLPPDELRRSVLVEAYDNDDSVLRLRSVLEVIEGPLGLCQAPIVAHNEDRAELPVSYPGGVSSLTVSTFLGRSEGNTGIGAAGKSTTTSFRSAFLSS
jgi:hypothetical protein